MIDLFMSYVEEDGGVAAEVAAGLEAAGYHAWFYERDSVAGVYYTRQVMEVLESATVVLVIISPHTLHSPQVDKEIIWAHEAEKAFIPVLVGLSHPEFRRRRPDWSMMMGAAVALTVPAAGVSAIMPRLVRGMDQLRATVALRWRDSEVDASLTPPDFDVSELGPDATGLQVEQKSSAVAAPTEPARNRSDTTNRAASVDATSDLPSLDLPASRDAVMSWPVASGEREFQGKFAAGRRFWLATVLALVAAAAGDGRTETYESPQYGFTLEYDPSVWRVTGEDDDPDDPYDFIQLEHDLIFFSITGDPDYSARQLDDCVGDYLDTLTSTEIVDNVREVSGESGEADNRSWSAFTYELDIGAGEPQEASLFIQCQLFGDVTIVLFQTSLERDYEDFALARETLMEGFSPPE